MNISCLVSLITGIKMERSYFCMATFFVPFAYSFDNKGRRFTFFYIAHFTALWLQANVQCRPASISQGSPLVLSHEAACLCLSSCSGVGNVDFSIKLTRASTLLSFKISEMLQAFLFCWMKLLWRKKKKKHWEHNVCGPEILGGEKEANFKQVRKYSLLSSGLNC